MAKEGIYYFAYDFLNYQLQDKETMSKSTTHCAQVGMSTQRCTKHCNEHYYYGPCRARYNYYVV